MPVNKNAIIRYQALDKCFSNPGRKYDINLLVDSCNNALKDINPHSSGVKKRQVYDDIKFMKDSIGYDAPIETQKAGRKVYYFYSDHQFTINKQPLNEFEAQQLRETLMTLNRFRGLPQFEWIDDMNLRLEKNFNLSNQDNIISFDDNPYLKGREFIKTLFQAIANKQVINIEYQSFKIDTLIQIQLHPYHLKQYNNRWFLFGLQEKYNSITNLALDRIEGILATEIDYIENKQIDFNEYFDDIVGVTHNQEATVEKVILKVDKELWPYIKTKPLHGSQKVIERRAEYVIVQLEVQLNFEIESLICSFSDNIQVLKPISFINTIKKKITNLESKYFHNHKY